MVRRILAVATAGLVSACTVGPTYRAPEITMPDRYALVAPVRAPSQSDVNWWLAFNDRVLDELIRQGLVDGLSVKQVLERLREAEAVARREGVPVSGSATYNSNFPSPGTDRQSGSLGLRFGLAGQSRWSKRGADQRLQAAEFDLTEAQRQLLAQITTTYVDLRFFQQSLDFLQDDLRSRLKTLDDVQTQLSAGAATQLDEIRARSLVTETRSQIPNVTANIVRQRNRLSTLLGKPVGLLNIDLGYRGGQPRPKQVAKIGVPADLLRARPDIRAAERRYAAAVSDIGSAEAARFPTLSLSGDIGEPLTGGTSNRSFGAGISIPVFNQPALAAQVDANTHRAEQAYLQWKSQVLSAVEEVENAMASLQASAESVRQSAQLVELNSRALNLSRQLLDNSGTITVLDVLDRERALSSSRASLANSVRSVATDYISLRVALGQGHTFQVGPAAAATNPTLASIP